MEEGFDGVEVHGANGYLVDQFLRDSINDRTDRYGGSIENRVRLPLEILRAIASAIGGGRTGLRISPVSPVNDAGQDSDAQALVHSRWRTGMERREDHPSDDFPFADAVAARWRQSALALRI